MSFQEKTLEDFSVELASKAAVPGGGGAAGLVGAVGASLASMVGNLTIGKKKYADVEEQAIALTNEADALRKDLLACIDADAEAFEPLSKAYSIPKENPERDALMEEALKAASLAPFDTMKVLVRAIEIHEQMEKIGSVLAISDVGVGVICCKAALQSASLNIFINTKLMKDRDFAQQLEADAENMLAEYCSRADAVYESVYARLKG